MRRFLLVTVAILGLSTAASANWGTPPMPQQAAPAPAPTNMYGWNQKLLWWKKAPCSPSNCGPNGCGPSMGQGMPGTLVFPQHPYVRSPRDFFMYESK